MGLDEGVEVDGAVRDQDDDASAVQIQAVVDVSPDHLGAGVLARARIDGGANGKLLQEGES